MTNIDLGSIVIVGAAISFLQEFIQAKQWSNTVKRGLVIVLSIIAAAIYVSLKDSAFWATFVTILSIASTVYLFVIKQLFPDR